MVMNGRRAGFGIFLILLFIACVLGIWELWFDTIPKKVDVLSTIPGISLKHVDPLRTRALFFDTAFSRLKQFDIGHIGGNEENPAFRPTKLQIWLSRPEVSAENQTIVPSSSPESPVSAYSDLYGGFVAEVQGETLVLRVFGHSQNPFILEQELNQHVIAAAGVLDANFYKSSWLPDMTVRLMKNPWWQKTITIKSDIKE